MLSDIKLGSQVMCPPDRSDYGYRGRITYVGQKISENLNGTRYVWVTVQDASGHHHVWPSNRLGFTV